MQALILAVIAMLVQQALSFMSTLVLPILTAAIALEMGAPTWLVGVYTGFMYSAALASAMSSGIFIRRYGALRVSQVALVIMASGLLAGGPGWLALMPLSAVLIGIGSSVATPASSDILARYSPPAQAPLIFSIKQTGVPVGGVLAGLLVPLFAELFGWRGAFVASAAMCLALAVILQPLRREYDSTRDPLAVLSLSQVLNTLRLVVREPAFRELSLACLTFVGIQSLFGAFFVTYLVDGLDFALAEAGFIFALAQGTAIGARIVWGWIASRWTGARAMLGGLGVVMAFAASITGFFTGEWSSVAIAAAAIVYSATAISWHGVLLAEVARLSQPQTVAANTGGVLSFASAGMLIYPSVFSLVLGTSGDYGLGFVIAGPPALLAGLLFFRRR